MRFDWSMSADARAFLSRFGVCLWVGGMLSLPGAAFGVETQSWDATSSLARSAPPPGLALVLAADSPEPASSMDRLKRAGFHVAVALPPRLYYVVREGAPRSLPVGFAYAEEPPSPEARAASAEPPGGEALRGDPFAGRPDVIGRARPSGPRLSGSRSPADRAALSGLPIGARWFDTSEFMMGRVAVSILFPESDGSLDSNRYDWTAALRDSVVRSAVRGLGKWGVFAARRGVDVTFAIEVHSGLATRYEPIKRTVGEEEGWIQDMLTPYLGYRADARTQCYDVANSARARLGAQWAALIFPVCNDSLNSAFPDGYLSHSTYGGPYFVAPINNLNTQSATLDYYMSHEMAHIFWSLDEGFGPNAWWACTLTSGYLNVPNYNSMIPSAVYCSGLRGYTDPRQCLMRGNWPDSICAYTEGQVGWADRDQSGAPDLLETHPIVNPDSSLYRATAGAPITLTGYALEIPLGNQNPEHFGFGDSISIATIDSVTLRLETAPPVLATPIDGAYDSGREYVSVTLAPLPPGEYVAEWDTWNSSGKQTIQRPITSILLTAARASADVALDPRRPSPSLIAGPVPSDGRVWFRLVGPPGGEALARLHDIQGRALAKWSFHVPSSGLLQWSWDGRVESGAPLPGGLYFLTVDTGGTRVTRRLVISR